MLCLPVVVVLRLGGDEGCFDRKRIVDLGRHSPAVVEGSFVEVVVGKNLFVEFVVGMVGICRGIVVVLHLFHLLQSYLGLRFDERYLKIQKFNFRWRFVNTQ